MKAPSRTSMLTGSIKRSHGQVVAEYHRYLSVDATLPKRDRLSPGDKAEVLEHLTKCKEYMRRAA